MSRHESAHKSAQTIETRWLPARYPMKWVDSPDAVPPWDSTRGGDSYVSLGRQNDETYEACLERDKMFGYVAHEISAPPKGYPRLVRVSPWSTDQPQDEPEDRGKRLVIALARLIPKDRKTPLEQIIVTEEFKSGVLEIAARFGGYSKDDPGSVHDWACGAIIAAAHLDLLEAISLAREVGFDLKTIQENLCDAWGITLGEDTALTPGWLAQGSFQFVFSGYPIQVALRDGIQTAQGFRDLTVEHLRTKFMHHVKEANSMDFLPRTGTMLLRVGIDAWLLWELASVYAGGDPVARCPGCGTFFLRNGKQKYCEPNQSRCKMRDRRKIATTAPQLVSNKPRSKPVKP